MLAVICSLLRDDFYILLFVFISGLPPRLSVCLHLCVISSVWYLDIVCPGLIFAGYISNWQCGIVMIFVAFPWGAIGRCASCYLSGSRGFYSVAIMFGARDDLRRLHNTRGTVTAVIWSHKWREKERTGCSRSVSMQQFPRKKEVHFIGDELIYKSL